MKLILRTSTAQPDSWDELISYALVILSKDAASQLLVKQDLLDGLQVVQPNLHEMEYCDGPDIVWFGLRPVTGNEHRSLPPDVKALIDVLNSDGFEWVECPKAMEIPQSFQVETQLLYTALNRAHEVFFRCYPKHVAVQVETSPIHRSTLEQIALAAPLHAPATTS